MSKKDCGSVIYYNLCVYDYDGWETISYCTWIVHVYMFLSLPSVQLFSFCKVWSSLFLVLSLSHSCCLFKTQALFVLTICCQEPPWANIAQPWVGNEPLVTASFLSYHLPVYIPVVVFKYNGPELDCSVGWALKRFSSGSNNFLALARPSRPPSIVTPGLLQ